jgi:hypothetical protein
MDFAYRFMQTLVGANMYLSDFTANNCENFGYPYIQYAAPTATFPIVYSGTIGANPNVWTGQVNLYNSYYYMRIPPPDTSSPTSQPGVVSNGFDFGEGCKAGGGNFSKVLPAQGISYDIGIIPAGKEDVYVKLSGTGDIDIQLFDFSTAPNPWPEGEAIIAWCSSPDTCNFGNKAITTPSGGTIQYTSPTTPGSFDVTYSGYGFVPDDQKDQPHDEFIRITGRTTVPLLMRAYAYYPGSVEVEYTWGEDTSDCCKGLAKCEKEFSDFFVKDTVTMLQGTIPAGVRDVYIQLTAETDIDIQLYDPADPLNPINNKTFEEGRAIVGWCYDQNECNYGLLAGPTVETYPYMGNTYTYSGYYGINNDWGDEYISVSGVTQIDLKMGAFAYLKSGNGVVKYSFWRDPDP